MKHTKISILFLLCILVVGCADNKLKESQNYFEVGKVQEEKQLLDSAAISYRKAIEALDKTDNTEQRGVIYNQLGNLFLHANLYNKATDVFKEAIKNNSVLTDKTYLSVSLRGKGKSFLFLDKPDSALHYFIKAFELSNQIEDIKEILLINNNLSTVYYVLQQYDKAYFYNQQALSLSKDSSDLFREWLSKADILMEFQQYDSAWYYYTLASQSPSVYTKAGCYWAISELTRILQLPDSSKYLKLFTLINDSIERLDQRVQVHFVDSHYLETRKLIEEKKISVTHQIFIIILFVLVASFLTIHYTKKLKKEKHKFEEEQKKVLLLHEEMLAIQSELDSKIENENNLAERTIKCERIEEIRKDLIESIKKTAENCAKNLFKQNHYREIKRKLRENPLLLTNDDRKQLYDIITKTYQPFILNLVTFLGMAEEDCYLCCLALSKFTTKESSYLKKASWDAVRAQKSRIKKKNSEMLHSLELFEFVFSKNNNSVL